jgi:transposase-like protein
MTRKEAFAQVIHQRSVHRRLGITSNQVRSMRQRLKEGHITEDKMKETLEAYGAQLKQQEVWEV